MKKICSKCKRDLPLDMFIKNKQCANGRAGICRDCSNAYCTEWKRKNSARLAPIRRQQYAERWGIISRENERQRKINYPIRVRAQLLRSGMLNRSRNNSVDFDNDFFTVEYLMVLLKTNPYCECCGKKLDIGFKLDKQKNNLSPSMDRKIPGNGYTKDNTALLCWRCNNLKRDASVEELETIIKWMRSFGNEQL